MSPYFYGCPNYIQLSNLCDSISFIYSVGTNKKQYLMPAWPTLYPTLVDGKSNERIDTRAKDMIWADGGEKDVK